MDSPLQSRSILRKTYIKAAKKDIYHALNYGPHNHPYDNFTSRERKALRSQRTRTDIVIKPTDKGSATVIMLRDDYLVKVMDHLENKNFYQRLDEDPTAQFAEEITSFLINLTDE